MSNNNLIDLNGKALKDASEPYLRQIDPKVAQRVRDWLQGLSLFHIKTRESFGQAYTCLALMALHFSCLPDSDLLLKGIAEARRCVTDYAKVHRDYLETQFPHEVQREIDERLRQLRKAYAEMLPPEQREEFLRKVEGPEIDS